MKKYLVTIALALIMVFAGFKTGLTVEAANAQDVVAIAAAEVGTSGCPNEYTQEYGSIGNTYNYPWCHAFVSWVANHAGAQNIIPRTARCADGVSWFKNQGRWYSKESGYTPAPGDIIYFDFKKAGSANHVGIVTSAGNGRVHTIEGNANNAVLIDGGYSNGYALTDVKIIGYGKPAYGGASAPAPAPAPAVNNPVGNVDIVSGGEETVRVAGWAFDRDVPSKSIGIHVYVGGPAGSGAPGYQLTANIARQDVNNAHGLTGNHGFDKVINVTRTGSQTVYIYAINEGSGNDNPLIGKGTVTISKKAVTTYDPKGCIDVAESTAVGKLRVAGWAFDKDTPSKSIGVHVYVGGPAGSGAPAYGIKADTSRPDVNAAFGLSGNHGFDQTISVSKKGSQKIYIYAINEGGGNNVLIGTKTVTINEGNKPQGCVDIASGGDGTIRVAGWAFDKDVPSKSITVHLYVGGPAGSGAPGYVIKANTARPDVNKVYGLTGNHGFDQTITVSKKGSQTIYFYAINEGGDSGNPQFAVKTVTIR